MSTHSFFKARASIGSIRGSSAAYQVNYMSIFLIDTPLKWAGELNIITESINLANFFLKKINYNIYF